MEQKYTPGPWTQNGDIVFAGSYMSGSIADCSTEANARLIAAAPEMLEACKRAKTEMCNLHREMIERTKHAPTGCPCSTKSGEACQIADVIFDLESAIAKTEIEIK